MGLGSGSCFEEPQLSETGEKANDLFRIGRKREGLEALGQRLCKGHGVS